MHRGHRRAAQQRRILEKHRSAVLVEIGRNRSPEIDAVVTLIDQGYYRIDFWGPIPSYLYKNCTSVFFKDPALLRRTAVPSVHRSSVGISCFQAMNRRAAPPEI